MTDRRRWTKTGTVASGADSGIIPVHDLVREVRVSLDPGASATVYSTNVPMEDIVAGSWEEWDKGPVTGQASDVVFGATAIKVAATGGASCKYYLTGF